MNGMTFESDTPHGRMMATMLEDDPRDRQPSHGGDREVFAPGASTLHEFGDERIVRKRIEGKIKAVKLGASLDNVPGTRHMGFGCHDAFPFAGDGFDAQSLHLAAPAPFRSGRSSARR